MRRSLRRSRRVRGSVSGVVGALALGDVDACVSVGSFSIVGGSTVGDSTVCFVIVGFTIDSDLSVIDSAGGEMFIVFLGMRGGVCSGKLRALVRSCALRAASEKVKEDGEVVCEAALLAQIFDGLMGVGTKTGAFGLRRAPSLAFSRAARAA